jgi:Polyketide cyclase / dehydrase and lipid transport
MTSAAPAPADSLSQEAQPADVVSLDVAAPADRVWGLVSDIRNMGRWSPETFSTRWLRGARGPAPGARFRGWNRWRFFYWATNSVVDVADPGREFTFTTVVWGKRRTQWSYRFEGVNGGTRVTELRTPFSNTWFRRFFQGRFMPGHKESFAPAMLTTLQRIKAAAEAA